MRIKDIYKSKNEVFEKVSKLPSMTIPDQSYTIKQLLEFHKAGINPPLQKTNVYDEEFEEEVNPMRKQNFDLTDVDNIKEDIDNNMKVIDKLRKSKKEKELLKEQKRLKEEAVQEFLNKQKTPE